MTVSAVIPTIGAAPELLLDLLDVLHTDSVPTVVLDNGMPPTLRLELGRRACRTINTRGMGLYPMWDLGVGIAGTDHVAVLNDDIRILPGTIRLLGQALDDDPQVGLVSADYTRPTADGLAPIGVEHPDGTYRNGGACGWCFAVRRRTYPNVGGGYLWWCGDDELVARLRRLGMLTGIYRGVPVDHQGEASAITQPWTHEAKARDLATFASRWQHASH